MGGGFRDREPRGGADRPDAGFGGGSPAVQKKEPVEPVEKKRPGSKFDTGAPTAVAAASVNTMPSTVSTKERRLRQLGVRNGWAEFVDQHNGEHIYKNVLTGETTNRKPAEYGSLITDTMNQRRLSWLANQRASAAAA